jgi:hypothetical protein
MYPSSLSMQFLILEGYIHILFLAFHDTPEFVIVDLNMFVVFFFFFFTSLRLGIELPFYLEFTFRRVRYNIINQSRTVTDAVAVCSQ